MNEHESDALRLAADMLECIADELWGGRNDEACERHRMASEVKIIGKALRALEGVHAFEDMLDDMPEAERRAFGQALEKAVDRVVKRSDET